MKFKDYTKALEYYHSISGLSIADIERAEYVVEIQAETDIEEFCIYSDVNNKVISPGTPIGVEICTDILKDEWKFFKYDGVWDYSGCL